MKDVPSWTEYFREIALRAASRSKDPSTNVGAVLVDKNKSIIETGYNGFPPGITDTRERWTRPTKYDYVVHAEQNAIARAAKAGKSVDGADLYVTHFPCKECAKIILASGVRRVYVDGGVAVMHNGADKDFVMSLFTESGVEIYYLP